MFRHRESVTPSTKARTTRLRFSIVPFSKRRRGQWFGLVSVSSSRRRFTTVVVAATFTRNQVLILRHPSSHRHRSAHLLGTQNFLGNTMPTSQYLSHMRCDAAVESTDQLVERSPTKPCLSDRPSFARAEGGGRADHLDMHARRRANDREAKGSGLRPSAEHDVQTGRIEVSNVLNAAYRPLQAPNVVERRDYAPPRAVPNHPVRRISKGSENAAGDSERPRVLKDHHDITRPDILPHQRKSFRQATEELEVQAAITEERSTRKIPQPLLVARELEGSILERSRFTEVAVDQTAVHAIEEAGLFA
jgi:hypothetical protein